MEAEALQLPPPPPTTTADGVTAWTDPRLARRGSPLDSTRRSSAGPELKKNFLLVGHLRRPNGDPANI